MFTALILLAEFTMGSKLPPLVSQQAKFLSSECCSFLG